MSKSPSLRRIQADIRELAIDPSDRYYAAPLENDMFEWHFTIRGADGTDFEGGIYHGRILLPAEYPFKPPNIVFLTPSGRFETGVKVCLSFSAYHPELWQPAWGIRLILEALISFLPTPADGAIGALDWTPQERKRLAKKSREYCCPLCGPIIDLLPKLDESKKKSADSGSDGPSRFRKEIEQLHQLQIANEAQHRKMAAGTNATPTTPTKKEITTANDTTPTTVTNNQAEEEKIESTAAEPPATAKKEEEEIVVEEVKTMPTPEDTKEQQQEQEQSPVEAPPQTTIAETTDPKPEEVVIPWFSDPVVHAIILSLCALVYLLLRKVNALVAELQELERITAATTTTPL